jgi:hypothetical protein
MKLYVEQWMELLIKIRPGETICLTSDPPCIVQHNSWGTTMYRWWYEEDKLKLIEWIRDNVTKYINVMGFVTVQEKQILGLLATGLRNLAMTYSNTVISQELSDLIMRIEKKIYGFYY